MLIGAYLGKPFFQSLDSGIKREDPEECNRFWFAVRV